MCAPLSFVQLNCLSPKINVKSLQKKKKRKQTETDLKINLKIKTEW